MNPKTVNGVLVLNCEFGSVDALISTLLADAKAYNCEVEGRFNGVVLRATPQSTYVMLSRAYWDARIATA